MQAFLGPFIALLSGIALLFTGGEIFVQGSIALSLILGIPQIVIGLTVVSLGTSSPELFVSVNSFLQGSDALAVSNVVGSNIFNVMVVLGSSALVLPLKVKSRLVRRDVPLLLGVSAAVWGMASSGNITWQAGLSLLIALIINTIWEIKTAIEEPQKAKEAEPEINSNSESNGLIYSIFKLIVGIILLTFGSKFLVSGASSIALLLGVSEAIIGLTIVSIGTSMPELVTSLVAAIRGRTDLAIGNVVGSSLLNQLLVLGGCALLSGNRGLEVNQVLINKDLPIMVIASIACMPIFWTKGKISRGEGGTLLCLYILYLADKIIPIIEPSFYETYRILIMFLVMPITTLIISYKSIKYWIHKNKSQSIISK